MVQYLASTQTIVTRKEKARLRAAAYRASRTPEQHEADKEAARRHFQDNKHKPEYKARKLRDAREFYNRNREHLLVKERSKNALLRLEVIDKLGGRCSLCGLSDHRALEFDHVNGDGYLERSSTVHSSSKYIRMLKRDDLFKQFQLLCGSCHNIKTYEKGEHRRREARPQPLGNVSAIQSIPKEI